MGVLMKKGVNYSGNMGLYESPNLDYDRAVALDLPDYTGYSYTMPADGVIMSRSYGDVGSTVITANSIEYGLSYRSDTWSTVFMPFEKGTVMTIRKGAQYNNYPSGSWIKFIPYKIKFGSSNDYVRYSTEEHVVGKWIDGSTVYEKTFSIQVNIPSGGSYTLMDGTGITLLRGYGCVTEGSNSYCLPYPSLFIEKNSSNNIILRAPSPTSWNLSSGNITIQYTKTT